jgi:hypothetical protein
MMDEGRGPVTRRSVTAALPAGDDAGEGNREMAEFGDHGVAPMDPRIKPGDDDGGV